MTRCAAVDGAQLYTVRVWRCAGRWRAAVRAVGEEDVQLFTEPAPLARWLLQPAQVIGPDVAQAAPSPLPHGPSP